MRIMRFGNFIDGKPRESFVMEGAASITKPASLLGLVTGGILILLLWKRK